MSDWLLLGEFYKKHSGADFERKDMIGIWKIIHKLSNGCFIVLNIQSEETEVWIPLAKVRLYSKPVKRWAWWVLWADKQVPALYDLALTEYQASNSFGGCKHWKAFECKEYEGDV